MNAWYLCRAEWNLLFCFFNFQLAYFPPSALLAFCRTAGQTLDLWLLWSTLAAFLFVCLLQGLLQPKAELFNLGTADVLGSLNLCCWRQSCELQDILVASLALLLCGQQHTPSLLSAVTTKLFQGTQDMSPGDRITSVFFVCLLSGEHWPHAYIVFPVCFLSC